MAMKLLAFGDAHFPFQNDVSISIVKKIAAIFKPDLTVCLGDMLDCSAFSSHEATFNMPETNYETELEQANDFLDAIQEHSKKTVYVEGNHEYRIDRWAAKDAGGRAAYSMLAPKKNLSSGRKNFTYIPYNSADGNYSHYRISDNLVAVHGWSYCKAASARHLDLARGTSIIHGHTHRAQTEYAQEPFEGKPLEGRSAGCLCNRVPLYNTSSPVQWVNGCILGYVGRRSQTMYTIIIDDNHAILPDGTEVRP